MVYVFWILSLFLLYYFLENRKKKRIEEIINLIDQMEKRSYGIPMKEDDFSILEDKIYKLFIEIVEAREMIREKSKSQVEHLEDIAHQIKTPITSILFSLENLQMEGLEGDDVDLLKKQILRLNSLSDILLKLSSLDAKENSMKEEMVNFREVLDYALDNVDMGDKVKLIVEESLEENNIVGDFYWIGEALINILKNAINRPLCDELRLRSERNPLFTSLFIEDNGGGIEEENLKKIFKRFYKSPDSKGFGIGLAMAKSIVEKNGGEIFVKNKGKGASFELKFYNITQ